MTTVRPSEQMRDLGVVQYGAPVLAEAARPFSLPAEKDTAEHTTETLFASVERIAQIHPFAKGMGIAAPQIGISRAAAVVQSADRRRSDRPAQLSHQRPLRGNGRTVRGVPELLRRPRHGPPPPDDHGDHHRPGRE